MPGHAIINFSALIEKLLNTIKNLEDFFHDIIRHICVFNI